jgi:hypothetical protein
MVELPQPRRACRGTICSKFANSMGPTHLLAAKRSGWMFSRVDNAYPVLLRLACAM